MLPPHPNPLPQGRGDSSSAQTISPPRWGGVREERKGKTIFIFRGVPGGMSVHSEPVMLVMRMIIKMYFPECFNVWADR